MAGAYDHLIGELQPGDEGWLPLDANGTPSGPATKEPPPGPNARACAVMANPTEAVQNEGEDALVTTSGAPITDHMSSNVDKRLGGTAAPTTPNITTLNPSSAPAGVDLALVVAGSSLNGVTTVNVNGTPSAATNNTGSSVATTVLAATLVAGTAQVSVTSPNGTSNELPLTVTGATGRKSK